MVKKVRMGMCYFFTKKWNDPIIMEWGYYISLVGRELR